MWKKIMVITCCLVVAAAFAACGGEKTADSEKISVVTTIFPLYDWAENVIGDEEDVALTLLLDNGVDLHSFQPTADDIIAISRCDVFIYVGGESDEWVEDALKEAANEKMIVVDLMDVLGDGAKEEEIVEGMQAEAEEDGEEAEEETEYDEHVWLSLKNAVLFVDAIADALATADPIHADAYAARAAAYNEELKTLDDAYAAAIAAAPVKTLLCGDRFPFRYLVDDYGLDYYAAFAGCSAETEADFETIAFLAAKVDELGLHSILRIETSDGAIADTIKAATKDKDQQILTLDSLQGTVPTEDVSYLTLMEENLATLEKALR